MLRARRRMLTILVGLTFATALFAFTGLVAVVDLRSACRNAGALRAAAPRDRHGRRRAGPQARSLGSARASGREAQAARWRDRRAGRRAGGASRSGPSRRSRSRPPRSSTSPAESATSSTTSTPTRPSAPSATNLPPAAPLPRRCCQSDTAEATVRFNARPGGVSPPGRSPNVGPGSRAPQIFTPKKWGYSSVTRRCTGCRTSPSGSRRRRRRWGRCRPGR